MHVGMPVQESAVHLNRRDHAGTTSSHSSSRRASSFRHVHATGRKSPPATEAGVNSQAFGDVQHNLPVSDRRADIFGNMHRGQQRPLLVGRKGKCNAAYRRRRRTSRACNRGSELEQSLLADCRTSERLPPTARRLASSNRTSPDNARRRPP